MAQYDTGVRSQPMGDFAASTVEANPELPNHVTRVTQQELAARKKPFIAIILTVFEPTYLYSTSVQRTQCNPERLRCIPKHSKVIRIGDTQSEVQNGRSSEFAFDVFHSVRESVSNS